MSGSYSAGGYIPGPGAEVALHPDECAYNRRMECVRSDHTHDPAEAEQLRNIVEASVHRMRREAQKSGSIP